MGETAKTSSLDLKQTTGGSFSLVSGESDSDNFWGQYRGSKSSSGMAGIRSVFDERVEHKERRRKEAIEKEKKKEKLRDQARELRAKGRRFIVLPSPEIIKKKEEGLIKQMENAVYNKIFGPIGRSVKSRIEKFEKLRKYLTDFTVESELIWYRKAKGYLDNPDGDDDFNEIKAIEKMRKKADKKADDERKGHFKN